MSRQLLLGVVICAVVAVGQGPRIAGSAPAAAQPTERVEFRKAPPSCAHAIKDLHLEGQPVNCKEPPPPTYDPPQMHGPYRLIVPTYVGPLSYRDDEAPTFPAGVVSEDRQVIQGSALYGPPAWMPEGYFLETLRAGDTGSEDAIGALYAGPGQPVYITWLRRYTFPIDIILPNPDSVLIFEAVMVDGMPGVLWYPKSGTPEAAGLTTSLSYMEGNVETTIVGEGLDPTTAKAIALSMACGAACAGSEAGGPGDAETSRSQFAHSAPSTSPAGGETLTLVTPTEYRIIAGLATASDIVNVSYQDDPVNPYWHGFGYGEAALDLTDPAGGTEQRWVYFASYKSSGGGIITATTVDHHYPENPSGTHCTGRDVHLRLYGGLDDEVGRATYIHLANQAPAGDAWSLTSGWTVQYLGTPATWQEPGCGFTGTHLHQGLKLSSSRMTYNDALPNPGAVINPVSDYTNNWMFIALLTGDSDGDGCTDSQEGAMGFNPENRWDVYDVPVPAVADPTPNGPRNRKVDMSDVLAVLFYTFTRASNNMPNGNGVAYHSDKGVDTNNDGIADLGPNGIPDGRDYDRSASIQPNPPWDAGPPSGVIDMSDVLAALAQTYEINCTGGVVGGPDGPDSGLGRGGATLLGANGMAVDAMPGGAIDSARTVNGAGSFDVDVAVTAAKDLYSGYQFVLSYDDRVLALMPTSDVDKDGTLESWTYGRPGGATIDAEVVQRDLDRDSVVDHAAGGSALLSGATSATGVVATVRFQCVGSGTSPIHLVAPGEGPFGTTTFASGGGAIGTTLADAWITCSVD